MAAKKSKAGAIIAVTLGVLTLGAIGFFVFKRKSDSGSGSGAESGETTPETLLGTITGTLGGLFGAATNQPSANAGKSFKASAVSEEPSKKRIVINLAYPRPAKGTIVAGNKVTLTNFDQYNGEYPVTMVWIDSSNAIGAIYLPTLKATTASVDNTKWNNIGVITIK